MKLPPSPAVVLRSSLRSALGCVLRMVAAKIQRCLDEGDEPDLLTIDRWKWEVIASHYGLPMTPDEGLRVFWGCRVRVLERIYNDLTRKGRALGDWEMQFQALRARASSLPSS